MLRPERTLRGEQWRGGQPLGADAGLGSVGAASVAGGMRRSAVQAIELSKDATHGLTARPENQDEREVVGAEEEVEE